MCCFVLLFGWVGCGGVVVLVFVICWVVLVLVWLVGGFGFCCWLLLRTRHSEFLHITLVWVGLFCCLLFVVCFVCFLFCCVLGFCSVILFVFVLVVVLIGFARLVVCLSLLVGFGWGWFVVFCFCLFVIVAFVCGWLWLFVVGFVLFVSFVGLVVLWGWFCFNCLLLGLVCLLVGLCWFDVVLDLFFCLVGWVGLVVDVLVCFWGGCLGGVFLFGLFGFVVLWVWGWFGF